MTSLWRHSGSHVIGSEFDSSKCDFFPLIYLFIYFIYFTFFHFYCYNNYGNCFVKQDVIVLRFSLCLFSTTVIVAWVTAPRASWTISSSFDRNTRFCTKNMWDWKNPIRSKKWWVLKMCCRCFVSQTLYYRASIWLFQLGVRQTSNNWHSLSQTIQGSRQRCLWPNSDWEL